MEERARTKETSNNSEASPKRVFRTWDEWIAICEHHVQQYGHLCPLANAVFEGVKLGKWLETQRGYRKNGKLSVGKFRELNTKDANFLRQLEKLKDFKREHGDCIVPNNEGTFGDDPYPLGPWVKLMRARMNDGSIPPEWEKALLDVGFPRDNKEAKWLKAYHLAKVYYLHEGDLLIPQVHIDQETGFTLGKWINRMRVYYGKEKLTEEKVAALEAIGMVWRV